MYIFSGLLYLNRQVITLLDDLGVTHSTFLRLQDNMLQRLTDMLFEENEAVKFLQSTIPKKLYDFEDISKSGIHLTTEPFFKALLLALHRHHIGMYLFLKIFLITNTHAHTFRTCIPLKFKKSIKF